MKERRGFFYLAASGLFTPMHATYSVPITFVDMLLIYFHVFDGASSSIFVTPTFLLCGGYIAMSSYISFINVRKGFRFL